MKKALLLFAFLVLGSSAFAVVSKARVTIGPITGDIRYADGTAASDNEQWALVLMATGSTFAGFTSDGKLVDAAHSAVVGFGTNAVLRTGIQWSAKKTTINSYLSTLGCSDAVLELYLLDTRTDAGYAPVDNETTYLPTTINAWVKVNGTEELHTKDFKYNTNNTSDSGSIMSTADVVIGAVTPPPVIVALSFADGTVTVEATNTAATAHYVLKGSIDPTFTNTVWSASTTNGAASATARMILTDPAATHPAAFYRIEVQ